jgi:hypothetical protein
MMVQESGKISLISHLANSSITSTSIIYPHYINLESFEGGFN